jgi:hypothetical protein
MTTFTTEDREWAYWNTYDCPKYSEQTEIKFFWPLTEQLEFDLDYGPIHIHSIQSPVYQFTYTNPTWTTGIDPTLSINPTNSVGQLNIGGISIGLEKKPNVLQRVLHKLLGFDWKDK